MEGTGPWGPLLSTHTCCQDLLCGLACALLHPVLTPLTSELLSLLFAKLTDSHSEVQEVNNVHFCASHALIFSTYCSTSPSVDTGLELFPNAVRNPKGRRVVSSGWLVRTMLCIVAC